MENVQQMAEFIQLWNHIEGVQLNDQEDCIRWIWTENGVYSSKSAYLAQFKGSYSAFKAKSIWKAHAEGKHKFFVWLLIQAKILTADKLSQRNWPCNPVCVLCDQEPETAIHLCLKCPFALEVWELVRSWTNNLIICRPAQIFRASIRGGLLCSKTNRKKINSLFRVCLCTSPGIFGRSGIGVFLRASKHRHKWSFIWPNKKWR